MVEVTQLIQRLQSFAQGCRGSMWQSRDETIRLMDEAAEALTTQTTALAAKEAELAAERAKVEKLREALKPFAAMANYMDNTEQRRDAIYCSGSPGLRCEVKKSDYHKARAALAETQPDETGRGVSGPPDRGEETANATATAPDLSGTQP